MRHKKQVARTWMPLLVAGSALLAGCGGDSVPALAAKARAHLDKSEVQAASIELKNALEKEPQNGELRYLLGRALYKAGDPNGAELELRKAQAARYNRSELLPLLAQVTLAQGKFKKVVDDFAGEQLSEPSAANDLATTVAAAQAYLGNLDAARERVEAVLKAQPEHVDAVMLQARLNASSGDVNGSVQRIQALLAKHPANVEAHMLLAGLLLQGKKDLPAAAASYRKAIELRPDQVEAYMALIALQVQQADMPAATQTYEAMKKRLPNQPQTVLAAAQLAAQRGDFKGAREHAQQLLRMAPESVRLLQFAGAVEMELGAFVQAEALLNKAVQLAPDLLSARTMLARIHLRAGQTEKALRVLKPESEATLGDGQMLALVAEAYLQNGDSAVAEQYFARALKLSPKDSKVRTALALMQLAKGRSDAAFAELRAVSAADADTTADMALIAISLRKGDVAAALAAIDAVQRKGFDASVAATLRGRAHLAGGDVASARQQFEKSLSTNPTYLPAISALASLDLADRNVAAAQQRYEALIKAEPKNVPALRTLAALRIQARAPRDEVIQRINAALKVDSTDAATRLLYIDYLMSVKDIRAAETVAQESVALNPNSVDLVDALGRVQIQTGNFQQALASFGKLAQLQPGSPVPYVRLAEVQVRSNNDAAAMSSMRRALEITPNHLPAQRGLVALAMKMKNPDQALAVVRDIKRQRPDAAVGYALEGEVQLAQKNWDAAIAAFMTGLTKRDIADLAPRTHRAMLQAKRAAEADRFGAAWVKDHPKDGLFLKYLGDVAVERRDLAGAEQRFKELLALDPKNAAVLNNVAWLYLQQKKPGALPFIEQAVALEPDSGTLLDTLAHALVAEKQYPKAIETAKRAVQLMPDNIGLRLSVAKVYLDAGDKALATAELDHVAQTARGNQAAQTSVEELRAELKKR